MIESKTITHKPEWLKTKLTETENVIFLKKLMRSQNMHTVCEEAKCPNIHECWGQRKTVTFMIPSDTCTRSCGLCAVKSGKPTGLDRNEPDSKS